MFEPRCIDNIAKSIGAYDIDIVITSTWRLQLPIKTMENYLGNELGKRVVGATPEIDDPFVHFPRYQEVKRYLGNHKNYRDCWVAINDESGNYPQTAPVFISDRRYCFSMDDAKKLTALIDGLVK